MLTTDFKQLQTAKNYFVFDIKESLTPDKIMKIYKKLDKIQLKSCYIVSINETDFKSYALLLHTDFKDFDFYDLQKIRKVLTSFTLDKFSNKLFIKLLNCCFFDSFL